MPSKEALKALRATTDYYVASARPTTRKPPPKSTKKKDKKRPSVPRSTISPTAIEMTLMPWEIERPRPTPQEELRQTSLSRQADARAQRPGTFMESMGITRKELRDFNSMVQRQRALSLKRGVPAKTFDKLASAARDEWMRAQGDRSVDPLALIRKRQEAALGAILPGKERDLIAQTVSPTTRRSILTRGTPGPSLGPEEFRREVLRQQAEKTLRTKPKTAADRERREDAEKVLDWLDLTGPSFAGRAAKAPFNLALKGAAEQLGLAEAGIGKLGDLLFTEHEQEQLGETLQAAQENVRPIARATDKSLLEILSPRAQKRVNTQLQGELQAMGVPTDVIKGAAEVLDNFSRNVSEGVIGFGPGVVAIGTQPRSMGGQLAEFYANFYEPLLRGDLAQFAANLKENPDMALDWIGAFGAVTGGLRRAGVIGRAVKNAPRVGATRGEAAVRAAVSGKEPIEIAPTVAPGEYRWGRRTRTRTYKYEGEDTGVQRYVPGSAGGLVLSDLWDKAFPRTRKMKERRLRKGVTEDAEARRSLLFGEIEGFRSAARKVEADPVQSLAFDRMLIAGGDAAKVANDIRTEIARRQEAVVRRQEAGQEVLPAQIDEITRLGQAADYLESGPSDNFTSVVDQGRTISSRTQEFLEDAGILHPLTAERNLRRYVQFLEDVPPVEHTPARENITRMLVEAAERSGAENPLLDPRVRLGLQWMDAYAHSWARRTGGTPEQWYDETFREATVYEHEDLNDIFIDNDPDVYAQRWADEESPWSFTISETKAKKHREEYEALTSDDPEVARAADERLRPKYEGRRVDTRGRLQRITDEIPDGTKRREYMRWYRDIWHEFERHFGEDATRALRSFLISQAAMSPADGITALLKALEYKHEHGHWPPKGILSHKTAEIVYAWDNINLGEDPGGIAAKISDFFNSAEGRQTRSFLQDTSLTGPGVVDRWSLRSVGYVDHKSYTRLVEEGQTPPDPNAYNALRAQVDDLEYRASKGRLTPDEEADLVRKKAEVATRKAELDEYYDMAGAPSEGQYEWTSLRLHELRELMNQERYDGRGDWTADEVQALDWFATRHEWGERGGGWEDTWGKNTVNVIAEVVSDLPRAMVHDALEEAARQTGARTLSVHSAGQHVRLETLSSRGSEQHPTVRGKVRKEQPKRFVQGAADKLAKTIARDSGRTAYTFYDGGAEASRVYGQPRRFAIDLTGDVYMALSHTVKDLVDSGLLVLPTGDGGLRIVFTDRAGNAIKGLGKAERDRLVEAIDQLDGVDATPRATIMRVHEPGRKPHLSLYRGDDARGVFARAASAFRRRSEFRVSRVVDAAGAERFVAGLAGLGKRAWAVDARTVDELLSGGYRGFVSDDGLTGSAVAPNGEIVSVFNNGGPSGSGAHAVVAALAEGGFWLQAFDSHLPPWYANAGFREIARLAFDERMAPTPWKYQDGRPDLVFMAFAPHLPVRTTGRYVKTFDEGVNRVRAAGLRARAERPIDDVLTELADRGDGIAHTDPNGQLLAQWRRTIEVTEGDPRILGAVRVTDDGVDMMITPGSNLSTIVHENAHATLVGTLEWLRQSDDPRYQPLLDLLGITDIDARMPNRAQELWARLVESHAFLGGMPAPQLRQMMAETSAEMRAFYANQIKVIAGDEYPEFAGVIEKALKDTDISTLLDDLVDVVYGVQRSPDAVFIPRIGPMGRSKIGRIVRKISGTTYRSSIGPPRQKPTLPGRSRGIRFERGEYEFGPEVIANYATQTFRWELGRTLAKEIYDSPMAKEITLDANGVPIFDDNHVPYVYGKVPGVLRVIDEQLGMAERADDIRAGRAADEVVEDEFAQTDVEPQELAEEIDTVVQEALRDIFPDDLGGIHPYDLAEMLQRKQVVQIPRFLAEAYGDAISGGTLLSAASKRASRDLNGLFKLGLGAAEVANLLARWSMIGKGAYITTNTVGAFATATVHNPFWIGEIRKSAEWLSNWTPEGLRMLDELVHAGSYEVAQVLEEGQSVISAALDKERRAYSAAIYAVSFPERRIRRMVMARELKASGIRNEADLKLLIEEAKVSDQARHRLNQMARHAEEGVIRFRGMHETEKWIVRRALFVYGWLRAAFRYTARFPLEHPVLAAAMNRIGNEGWEDLQDALEREIGFRGGILTREPSERENERIGRFIDPTTIFPFGTGMQGFRALTSPFTGIFTGQKPTDTIAAMFSPGVETGLTYLFGETPTGMDLGKLLSQAYGSERGFAAVPLASWIMRMTDPKYTETKLYTRRTRRDIVGAFFFGQLWPRDMSLDAAQEVWLRNQNISVSAPIRVQADLDFQLEKLHAASMADDGYMDNEWMTAFNAHATYDLTSRVKKKEWDALDDKESDAKRSTVRARVLERFYPGAFQQLIDDGFLRLNSKKKITALDVETVDEEYDYWVTDTYSEARSYIRDVLGEDALDEPKPPDRG